MAENTILEVPRRRFFYDAQMVRLLTQMGTKIFGGYQVISGTQRDGRTRLQDVNCLYGGMSRMIQYLFNPSDNVIPALPVMSYTVSSLRRNARAAQEPQHTQQHVVRVRARDPDGNLLINQPGKLVVIERMMPAPYEIGFDLAIWSSNTDQMFQLLEQICATFNPDQEIQLSNSPLDWASITRVIFGGDVTFEEITPAKTVDPMQVCRLQFASFVLLSLPVKVYDATLIHEIDVKIHEQEDFGYFMFGDNIEIPTMPLLDMLEIKATPEQILDAGNQ